MIIGEYTLSVYDHGQFRLDGGSMFGVVPRPIWSTFCPPDEKNRITLSTRSLILRSANRCVLIDVGNGNKWNEKQKRIFMFEEPKDLPPVHPSEVTDVILTHLHFDHAGGVSYFDADGDLKLTYPQARHYLQRSNFETAMNPSLREKASYLPENVNILEQADLKLLDGTEEILPGITVHRVNGHTLGQQCVEISVGDQMIFFATDLIPTSHHLPIPYNMGYDICAATILNEKQKFLSEIELRNGIIVFQHDPEVVAARIHTNSKGHYSLKEKIKI